LLHAAAESAAKKGRPQPEMLGVRISALAGKANKEPTMAELRQMSDEAAWAWCVRYFWNQVSKARSASGGHKFVFPAYKDGI